MAVTAQLTRDRIWDALGWWANARTGGDIRRSETERQQTDKCLANVQRNGTTGDILYGSRDGNVNRGVVLSSASLNYSILCLTPWPNGTSCPCCWRLPKGGGGWWARDFSGCHTFNILW